MFGDNLFRRYSKPLIIVIFGLVIFTFIFWGMGDPSVIVDRLTGVDRAGNIAIGRVGGELISPEEYGQVIQQQRARAAQMRGGEEPSNLELWESGAAIEAFDQLANAKLIQVEAQDLGRSYAQEFLTDQLKEDPFFQTENGEFDAQAWNDWVSTANHDWQALYAQTADNVNRSLLVERVMASARTLTSELRQRFERENTQMTVRYAAVEPVFDPSEEAIQEKYAADPSAFATDESRVANFVALSLKPERPADLADLRVRAQNQESFEEIALPYAEGSVRARATSTGWTPLGDDLDPQLEPLRGLEAGEVSEWVERGQNYDLFRVVADREGEGDAPREVLAERLTMTVSRSPQEREALRQQAETLLEDAQEAGDLGVAALGTPYDVLTTSPFNMQTAEIVNVPTADVFPFRTALNGVDAGGFPERVIAGREGLYVAQVTEVIEPQEQPLEDVREEVVEALKAEYQQTQEYRDELAALGDQIAEAADSIDEVTGEFGQYVAKEGTTSPFTVTNWRFEDQVLWNARDVYDAVGRGERGAFGGPINDFTNRTLYFVELVGKTPPSEEAWEIEWPAARERMKMQEMRVAESRRLNDYLLWLRAQNADLVQRNDLNILRYLGLDTEPGAGSPEGGEMPAEDPVAEGK